MSRTGDFIVPYFNGEFRFQKPVLTYWLIALCSALGGDDPVALRASAGLMVAAANVLVWRLGNRMFGPPAGILAGVILATAPTTVLLGKLCIPDGPQFFFSTLCFAALYDGFRPHEASGSAPAPRWAWLWFWIGLAGTILSKGPIVLGMVATTAFAHALLVRARPSDYRLRWGLGLVVLSLLTLPWLASILACTGMGFFQESLGRQLAGRTVVSFDGRWLPPGYYAASLVVGFGPWLAFAVLAAVRSSDRMREPGPAPFLVAWIVGPMLLLEFFRSKQIHYFAPVYPALALLAGGYLAALARRECPWRFDGHAWRAAWSHGALGVVFAGALAAVGWFGPSEAAAWSSLASALVLIGTLLAANWLRRGMAVGAFWSQSAALGIAWLVIAALLLPALDRARIVRPLAEGLARYHAEEGLPILTHRLFEPSMVYYSGMNLPNLPDEEPFLRFVGQLDQPILVPMTEQDLRRLERPLAGRLEVLESWAGWVKMHADRAYLVRLKPRPEVVADRGDARRE